MQSYLRLITILATVVPLVLCDCQSFGIDFQHGGSYFQNSLSNDSFTALQQFQGCQNDTAHNVIIDPNGDQTECTETPLTPDNAPQQLICPQWPKNKLFDGAWSLLIISNNGQGGNAIAYQRDFSLTVGPQQTITAPVPTISGGTAGTSTITPAPVTATVTVGLIQVTQISTSVIRTSTTTVVPASCSISTSTRIDPLATILPSILGGLNLVAANAVATNTAAAAKRSVMVENPILDELTQAIIEGRVPSEDLRKAFIQARKDGLQKGSGMRGRRGRRAPDLPTVTSTPAPTYVPAIITTTPLTATATSYVLYHVTSITTRSTTTSTSTIKTTPAGAAAACSSSGGVLV